MKSFLVYFTMQLKRIVKIFPTILCTTLLLCSVLGLGVAMLLQADGEDERQLKVSVGLVGELDTYMGYDINVMLDVLSSRFGAEFVSVTEKEARQRIHNGTMSAYVLLPEDLVENISMGKNDKPITYVTSDGKRGISGIVMDEVVTVIAELITCPQSSIFGMQNYLRDVGREDEIWQATEELNIIYITALIDIYKMGDREIIGMANQVSTAGYYACSVVVIFLIMSGLNCSSLFSGNKMGLCKLLVSKGQKVGNQVLGEYLAYFLLLLTFFCMVIAVVLGAASAGLFSVPELGEMNLGEMLLFVLQFIVVVGVISALQFLVYEMVEGVVSSILVQFILAVALGYIGGCFYPLSFMPEGLQLLGGLSPVGAALKYADLCLVQEAAWKELGLLVIYLVLFLLLTIWIRKRRVENEAAL
ncbi:MAG: ABC transporter permease [Lachnospiraceae bacterium]|nr:ABC transporter permease [Lachnospiraceae bacterium]